MNKLLSIVICLFLLVLAVSVWRQLDPHTRATITASIGHLWAGLVEVLANFVEQLVDGFASLPTEAPQ